MTLDETGVLENDQLAEPADATTRLTFDLETYFDEQYSLRNKKLPIEAYIRDERFEPLALAYAFNDGPIHSVLGPEAIADWIADQDWPRITATCHNAIFDLGVLSFLFGASPGGIIDTMALSRAVFGPGASAKLKDIASRMGLPRKTISYESFKGKHFTDLPPVGLRHLAAGCERDVELTREIANRLLVDFPPGELEIIDMTVRGFTEPVLIGDCNALEGIALSEVQRKASAAKALGLVRKTVRGKESYPELASSAKFTALLAECGVEVEVKDGKNGVIPAIAKTDAFMQSLRLRSDRAGQLAVARLDAKSSLNEDRAKRLADMARHGPMPVELKYCGAATTRFSGSGGANWQNLPNKRKDKELKLRGSIRPPPGQLLVVADFAQVELRVACALADEKEQLEVLRDPTRDSYREFGEAHLYKTSPISKDQRAFAKRTVLGCIYGMGHTRFAETCQDDGQPIDLQMAKAAVDAFRRAYPAIEAMPLAETGELGRIESSSMTISDQWQAAPRRSVMLSS